MSVKGFCYSRNKLFLPIPTVHSTIGSTGTENGKMGKTILRPVFHLFKVSLFVSNVSSFFYGTLYFTVERFWIYCNRIIQTEETFFNVKKNVLILYPPSALCEREEAKIKHWYMFRWYNCLKEILKNFHNNKKNICLGASGCQQCSFTYLSRRWLSAAQVRWFLYYFNPFRHDEKQYINPGMPGFF